MKPAVDALKHAVTTECIPWCVGMPRALCLRMHAGWNLGCLVNLCMSSPVIAISTAGGAAVKQNLVQLVGSIWM